MEGLFSPQNIITAIITGILADLLLRGFWAFVKMGPDFKEYGAPELRRWFMVAYPLGFATFLVGFVVRDSIPLLSGALISASAVFIILTASFFHDALQYIRRLENKVKYLTRKNADQNTKY